MKPHQLKYLVSVLGATALFGCASTAPDTMRVVPVASVATAASADVKEIPQYANVAQVESACKTGKIAIEVAAAAQRKRDSGAGALVGWDAVNMALEDVQGHLDLIANVHSDKDIRDAAEKCGLEMVSVSTALYQDKALYTSVKNAKPQSAIDTRLQRDILDSFEDAGVALSEDKRARVKAIFEKMEEHNQAFSRNVRDDKTKAVFTQAELTGVPAGILADWAKSKNADGTYSLGLETPIYSPFMQNVANEAARKRMYVARNNLGGQKNIELLGDIAKLRLELAQIFGLKDFAEYTIRRRMAKDAATVTNFLAGVEKAFTGPQLAELTELTKEKTKHTSAANAKLNRWDTSFYQERLKRERYAVDQEALRKYFPTEASVQFMLRVSSDLYGITFTEQKRPGWHSDVRYLEVRDVATKEYLGAIYLDLFPRDGKYNHAAVWPVRNVSVVARRSPIAALVTNFNRQGLNHDELETLLHEFGHALHTVLSKSQYNVHAGTNVKRDFVEAPSQMFEEWVRRESTLSLMKQVCPACPQLDSKQITQLDEARKFGRAMRYARQHQYASLDMALVGPQAKDPQKVWESIEGASPLGYVEGTRFPASFGHIAGGYAAGYYGYMWSEVLALDMLSAFKGSLMDKTVGMKYRRTILEPGAQRDANELVTEFLGRAPNSDAFFAEINGKR